LGLVYDAPIMALQIAGLAGPLRERSVVAA
jgi:hypothetical protein